MGMLRGNSDACVQPYSYHGVTVRDANTPRVKCCEVASHLVVDIELVDVAAVYHQLHELRCDVYMHALELPGLVVAALVGVEGEVAQALECSPGIVLPISDKDLHPCGNLPEQRTQPSAA